MTNTFIFHGYIEIEFEVLKPILDSLYDTSKLRYRHASGVQQEINFNDGTKELFIEEDFGKGFLFQAELKGTCSDAQNFINPLTAELINKNIEFEFQWNEYDDEDNVVGDEYEIINPPDNQPLA